MTTITDRAKIRATLPLFADLEIRRPSRLEAGKEFLDAVRAFSFTGESTAEFESAGLRYFVNEFWTSGQRQAHSLHEISYRAMFKPQLPRFFIERLTAPGDTVYDPFSGRGTTALEAALMGRRPIANDISPLSEILVRPRLDPPSLGAVMTRLRALDLSRLHPTDAEHDLLVFYHPETLREIRALRSYLLERAANGGTRQSRRLDPDGRDQSPDGPLSRVLLGLHDAAQSGTFDRLATKDQRETESGPATA